VSSVAPAGALPVRLAGPRVPSGHPGLISAAPPGPVIAESATSLPVVLLSGFRLILPWPGVTTCRTGKQSQESTRGRAGPSPLPGLCLFASPDPGFPPVTRG
jgi:hypothetical protein